MGQSENDNTRKHARSLRCAPTPCLMLHPVQSQRPPEAPAHSFSACRWPQHPDLLGHLSFLPLLGPTVGFVWGDD